MKGCLSAPSQMQKSKCCLLKKSDDFCLFRWWRPVWRWGRPGSTQGCWTVPSKSWEKRDWRRFTRDTSRILLASFPTLESIWRCTRCVVLSESQTSIHFCVSFSHTCTVCPSSELEELLAVPLRQRLCQPGDSGAARLWNLIQHVWPVSQLPSGSDPHQDAGTGYEELSLVFNNKEWANFSFVTVGI